MKKHVQNNQLTNHIFITATFSNNIVSRYKVIKNGFLNEPSTIAANKNRRLNKMSTPYKKWRLANTVAGYRQHHNGGHGHHVLYHHGAVLGYQGRHVQNTHHHITNMPTHSAVPLNASKYCLLLCNYFCSTTP